MAGPCGKVKHSIHSTFLEYKVPKTQRKDSKLLGCGIWIIRILIFIGIAGYIFVLGKYLDVSYRMVSSTATKVKGVSVVKVPSPMQADRVMDGPDYTRPSQENGALFVMTNAIITKRQTPAKCGADPNRKRTRCAKDADCPKGKVILTGVATGRCILSDIDKKTKVCEVNSWCPSENSAALPKTGKPLLADARNFTIMIKNQVLFPEYQARASNTVSSKKVSLDSCLYQANHPVYQHCPVFTLDQILKMAGQDFNKMALTGGFIVVLIEWDCYVKTIKDCEPKYTFHRLDDDDGVDTKSVGWNFRYANYYREQSKEYRDLVKAYGIRFVVEVTGKASTVNYASVIRILLAIGSLAGLFKAADFLYGRIASCVPNKKDEAEEGEHYEMESMRKADT